MSGNNLIDSDVTVNLVESKPSSDTCLESSSIKVVVISAWTLLSWRSSNTYGCNIFPWLNALVLGRGLFYPCEQTMYCSLPGSLTFHCFMLERRETRVVNIRNYFYCQLQTIVTMWRDLAGWSFFRTCFVFV